MESLSFLQNIFVRHKHFYNMSSKWTISHLLKLLLVIAIISRTRGQNDDKPSKQEEPLVLFISFDGFRYDYLAKTDTPNFDKLIAKGVQADYMIDAMVTKTFPNHYTLVTGLYEESHGIVGNVMYDPVHKEQFWIGDNSSLDPTWWKDGEPIWNINQNQGGHSAVFLYPGSNVEINGQYPNYYEPVYNSSIPYHDRVDMVVPHFKNGSVNLGILYYSEPDHSGHEFGPESNKMLEVIQECDETVGYLIDQLEKNDLYDKVNLIITSDHGMTATYLVRQLIILADYIDTDCCLIQSNNPLSMIWPHEESQVQSIYEALKNISHLNVYLKDEIPAEYHYSHNQRIPPILAVADEHWQVFTQKDSGLQWGPLLGEHGYNNSLMSMHPFFIAHGPAFKEGYQMKPFHNVDVYPLLCHILGIEPSANNGSFDAVKMMLKEGEAIVTTTAAATSTASHTTKTTTPVATTTTKESPHIDVVSQTPIYINIKGNLSMHALIGLGVASFIALIATFLLVAMCIRQRTYRQPDFEYMPIEDTSMEAQQVLRGPHAAYFYPNTKI